MRTIADMDERWIALLLLGDRGALIGEDFASQGGSELSQQRMLVRNGELEAFK